MLHGVPLQGFVDWVNLNTPLTNKVMDELAKNKYDGISVAYSSHLEPKMIPHLMFFAKRGMKIHFAPCVPGLFHSETFDYLSQNGIKTYGAKANTWDELNQACNEMLDTKPDFLFDIGGGLITAAVQKKSKIKAACEATSTGIENIKKLTPHFPVLNWNDIPYKNLMHNRYEVGSGIWYAFRSLTGFDICRMNVGVIGFGLVGQSVASIAKGLGARVYVMDQQPVRELSAASEGYNVGSLENVISKLDILMCATGFQGVVSAQNLKNARDGLMIASAGHDNREIDLSGLKKQTEIFTNLDQYQLGTKKIFLLADGKLLNLAAGGGSAINTFDLVTSLITRVMDFMVSKGTDQKPGLNDLPPYFGEDLLKQSVQNARI
jgi:adenosylhomocysteinase